MTIFSSLRQHLRVTTNQLQTKTIFGTLIRRRMGGHGHVRPFDVKTCDWNYQKATDIAYLYLSIAFIGYGSIILYANVFIGPAILAEIPEGYKPEDHEYHKHPIARAIQKYCFTNEQMEYEKCLHDLYLSDWKFKLQLLDEKVRWVMKKNKDYKAFYYRPISANTWRYEEEEERNRFVDLSANPVLSAGYPLDFKDGDDLPPPVEE